MVIGLPLKYDCTVWLGQCQTMYLFTKHLMVCKCGSGYDLYLSWWLCNAETALDNFVHNVVK